MSGDLFDIRGKVALVTGANAGIGFGYAEAIARQGGDVVIWGRRADRNEEARKRLAEHGGRVMADVVDVADEEAQIAAFARAISEMGALDCVIANAGFMMPVGFKDMTSQNYHDLIAVSQHGAFITLREGVRHMVERVEAGGPPGSLLATGSLSNFQAVPGMAHYAAAKCAVAAMIKNIAVEYGHIGIRANMVCAGLISTESVPGEIPEIAELGASAPVGRIGQPADLGGIVVYLMSGAAAFHTGDVITVDGGAMANFY